MGTINMARWVGVAGGPVIGGLLGEAFGFHESFWITGALLGLAGLAVILLVQEEFVPQPRLQREGFWEGYSHILHTPGYERAVCAHLFAQPGRNAADTKSWRSLCLGSTTMLRRARRH